MFPCSLLQHSVTFVINNGNLSLTEEKVFNQSVVPVLTCGAESCRLTKDFEGKMRSVQRGTEKKIPRYFGDDEEKVMGLGRVSHSQK